MGIFQNLFPFKNIHVWEDPPPQFFCWTCLLKIKEEHFISKNSLRKKKKQMNDGDICTRPPLLFVEEKFTCASYFCRNKNGINLCYGCSLVSCFVL